MVVYRLKFEFTPEMTSGHYRFPFTVQNGGSRLSLNYRYSPKAFEDRDISLQLIGECFARYGIEASDGQKVAELPLNNHITVSLDSPEGLVGTAHRHSNNATYEVSAQYSSPGFCTTQITAGEWALVLSTHAVLSQKVVAEVEVNVD